MGSLLNHPIVRYRLPVIILLHAVFAASALLLSFWLRFDFTLGRGEYPGLFYTSLPINIVLLLIFSGVFRLYQGIWRYVSVDDLLDITKAAALSSLCFMFVIVSSGHFIGYPRSIYILNFFFFVILNGGTRFTISILMRAMPTESTTSCGDHIPKSRLSRLLDRSWISRCFIPCCKCTGRTTYIMRPRINTFILWNGIPSRAFVTMFLVRGRWWNRQSKQAPKNS